MSTDLQPQPAGLDRSRLRALAPIAVFDIVGPLAVYYLLRMTGGSQVMALILSGIVPAIGILVGVIRSRHVSAIGILVLVGILAGSVLGLLTRNPKLVLMEGSVSTFILGIACFASLLTGKPLMFAIITETIGADTAKGRLLQQAWTSPQARPLFTRITTVWGVALLAEVVTRVIIISTISTGSALLLLKVMPYLLTGMLLHWTKHTMRRSPAFAGFLPPAATDRAAQPAAQPAVTGPAVQSAADLATSTRPGRVRRPEPAMAGQRS